MDAGRAGLANKRAPVALSCPTSFYLVGLAFSALVASDVLRRGENPANSLDLWARRGTQNNRVQPALTIYLALESNGADAASVLLSSFAIWTAVCLGAFCAGARTCPLE